MFFYYESKFKIKKTKKNFFLAVRDRGVGRGGGLE